MGHGRVTFATGRGEPEGVSGRHSERVGGEGPQVCDLESRLVVGRLHEASDVAVDDVVVLVVVP